MKIIKGLKRKYYSFKEGINNLIRWFPLIWKDRDFDQQYLYEIVHKKLSNMEEFFRSEHTYSMNALEVANEIKDAKDNLDLIISNIHTNEVDILTDEFINTNGGTFNVDRENPNYKKWMESMESAEQKENSGMATAFKIIGEKSQGWWD